MLLNLISCLPDNGNFVATYILESRSRNRTNRSRIRAISRSSFISLCRPIRQFLNFFREKKKTNKQRRLLPSHDRSRYLNFHSRISSRCYDNLHALSPTRITRGKIILIFNEERRLCQNDVKEREKKKKRENEILFVSNTASITRSS